MNESTGMIRFIREVVASAKSFPVFLVAGEKEAFQVEANPEALGGNPDGAKIILRQGRELALQHPQLRRNKERLILQLSLGSTEEGEVVIANMIDKPDGTMHAIPYQVVRDREGRVTNLVDTGEVMQITGAFLHAFLIGIDTSDQTEQHALQELNRKMKQLTHDFMQEAQKRIGRGEQS